MAEFYRYDNSRALDERDRIDIVPKGSSGGGGGAFTVTITDVQQYECTVDKSYSELLSALKGGQTLQVAEVGNYSPCAFSIADDDSYINIYVLWNGFGFFQFTANEGYDTWSIPD